MSIKISMTDLDKLKPDSENHYDEDIGFSETTHTITVENKEFTFSQPSGIDCAYFNFMNESEKNDVLLILNELNIKSEICNGYLS